MDTETATFLPCEQLGPETATHAVIWLHGLGASGHDFVPIVPLLNQPNTRFVFPHAPEQPVTINMGYIMPAWYDIKSLEPGPNRECSDGILASGTQVEALVQREIDRGIPSENIVLAGFSQGGAIALHVGLRTAHTLAGIMVLSAYETRPETHSTEASVANLNTPMLFCHGQFDNVVPMTRGQAAHQACDTKLRECLWRTFPMAHEVCGAEIEVISEWLEHRFQ